MSKKNEETAETEQQKLIRSDEFDKALSKGSDIKSEIHGSMKQRSRDNYERFYEIMLLCNDSIQSICDKRKKDRTPEENERLKKFMKETKLMYRFVRDFVFVPEDESLNEDGTDNDVPKKLLQLVERVALAYPLLKYVGLAGTFEREMESRGIHLSAEPLETRSPAYMNEQLRSDVKESLERSFKIQSEIEDAEREISESVFESMVPQKLQYDKDHNPGGLRNTDFKKLVDVKFRLVKSEKSGDDAEKEKASDKAFDEAKKKMFEIQRSETIRTGLIALGSEDGGNDEK